MIALRRYDAGTATWEPTSHPELGLLRQFVRGEDGLLYAVGAAGAGMFPDYYDGGVFRSPDGGVTWTHVYSGAAESAFVFADGVLLVATPSGLVWDGPDLAASAFRSFVRSASGTLFANTRDACVYDFDLLYYCEKGTGAYRLSRFTNTWQQAGYVDTAVYALALSPEGDVLAGTGEAVLTVLEGGWTAAGLNRGPVRALAASDADVYVAGGEDEIVPAGLRRLSDGAQLPVAPVCELEGCLAASVAVTPQGTLLTSLSDAFTSSEVGVFRSTDEGATWIETLPDVGTVRVFAAAPAGYVYAGARGGGPNGVFRSTDDGQTWMPFNDGLTNGEVHALIASAEGTAFAGTEDGVFLSTDGASWAPAGLAGRTVHAFAVAADGLLAGTDDGLCRRTGPGPWEPYGLEGQVVLSLLVTLFEGEELIVAGTEAGAYLSRPGLITVGVADPAPRPDAHALLAPFPNPARASVTVAFELAHEAPVRLVVYDVLGREVARLADAPFGAGRHALPWRTTGLAGGTYFVTLDADGTRATRAIVLVR